MDNVENLSGFWKEQLESSLQPAEVLLKMSQSILNITGNYLVSFRKLVKIYGRNNVYYSILDCSDMNQIDGDPYRILSYFCKKRLDTKSNPSGIIDIDEIEKKINKMTKGKISVL
jgi:hypothetical protein